MNTDRFHALRSARACSALGAALLLLDAYLVGRGSRPEAWALALLLVIVGVARYRLPAVVVAPGVLRLRRSLLGGERTLRFDRLVAVEAGSGGPLSLTLERRATRSTITIPTFELTARDRSRLVDVLRAYAVRSHRAAPGAASTLCQS